MGTLLVARLVEFTQFAGLMSIGPIRATIPPFAAASDHAVSPRAKEICLRRQGAA